MRRALALVLVTAGLLAVPAGAGARATPRIVGGTAAPEASWPSTVFLLGVRDVNGDGTLDPDFSCTGSVVAPSWVVTAGHCVFNPTQPGQLEPGMVAVLGAADYTDPAATVIAASQLIPDPEFFENTVPHNDIALVHLSQPTTQPPIALAQPGVTYATPANVANAAGWGKTDQAATIDTTVLQQAWLPIQLQSACQSLIAGFDAATMVCAGYPNVAGACHGDSGGPLLEFDPVTNAPVLWGITSFGAVLQPPCALTRPAAFTSVTAFQSFIQQHIAPATTTTPTTPTAPTAPTTPTTPTTTTTTAPVTTTTTAPPTTIAAPPPDHARPVIEKLSLSRHHFRAARSGATLASAIGATLSYRLSEPAKVLVTIQRPAAVRHRVRWTSLTPGATLVGRAGANVSVFSGRLGGRRLPVGTYRLALQAVDAAGNRSVTATVSFKLVAR